jgi:zinc/manganese transport system substrate-binding protein
MKKSFLVAILFLYSSFSLGEKPLKVVTSTTDIAWAAKEIGKNLVEVVPLLSGTENPHYVDTIPEFIRQVADAQVVCIIGLELEVGWMPKVLARSGNAQVQPGGKGYCETGKGVQVLEKPSGPIDRSMGDVHREGNPHFWLSPKALAEGASQIRDALVRVDPGHSADYQSNYSAFSKRLELLLKKNRERLLPHLAKIKGPAVIEYHKEFSYLFEAYGVNSMGSIEEKPGVPPSAGRIAEMATSAKSIGIKGAIAGEYAPHKTMERFSELSGVPSFQVPTSVQPKGKLKDYADLQNFLVETLILAVSHK